MAYQQQQYNRGQYTPARRQQSAPANAAAKANADSLITVLTKPANQEQFRKALGDMIPVERFLRVCQTAVRQTPKLATCSQASFLAALMQCAQLGLEPNTPQGLCYLVPYGSECQLQIGYKGLLALMYRSGMVDSVNAEVVYRQEIEQGLFECTGGAKIDVKHKYNFLNDARSEKDDDIVAAYACATLKTGQTVTRIVTRKELDKARQMSATKGGGIWEKHYKSMALKTAIRRLASWVPMINVSDAIAVEDSYARQAENVTGEIVTKGKPQKPVVQIVDAAPTAAIPQAPQQQPQAAPVEQQQAHEPAKRSRKKAAPAAAQEPVEAPIPEEVPVEEIQPSEMMQGMPPEMPEDMPPEPPIETAQGYEEPPIEADVEVSEEAIANFHKECVNRKLSMAGMVGYFVFKNGKMAPEIAKSAMGTYSDLFQEAEQAVRAHPGYYEGYAD